MKRGGLTACVLFASLAAAGCVDAVIRDGGASGEDAGRTDAGRDAGPDPCDVDRDGHLSTEGGCGGDDCDDGNASIYYDAPPICGNGLREGCADSDHAALEVALGVAEVGFFAPQRIAGAPAGEAFADRVAIAATGERIVVGWVELRTDGNDGAKFGEIRIDALNAEPFPIRFSVAGTALFSTGVAEADVGSIRSISIGARGPTSADELVAQVLRSETSRGIFGWYCNAAAGAPFRCLPYSGETTQLGGVVVGGGPFAGGGYFEPRHALFEEGTIASTDASGGDYRFGPAPEIASVIRFQGSGGTWVAFQGRSGELRTFEVGSDLMVRSAIIPGADGVISMAHIAGTEHLFGYSVGPATAELRAGNCVPACDASRGPARFALTGEPLSQSFLAASALSAIPDLAFFLAIAEHYGEGDLVTLFAADAALSEVPIHDTLGTVFLYDLRERGRVARDLVIAPVGTADERMIIVAGTSGRPGYATDELWIGGMKACVDL